MNEDNTPGEPPSYDRDLGADGPKWTRGIRRQILLGNWHPDPGKEGLMVTAFKASGLGVEEFLTKKEKGEI
jgi:hypothetical protein